MRVIMKNAIDEALKYTRDTRACVVAEEAVEQIPTLLKEYFPGLTGICVVADPRTWAAAGERVAALATAAGLRVSQKILEPDGKEFHADYRYVEEVRTALQAGKNEGIVPVAVGAGVINDLTKLASGELEIPYLTCATAASVDGFSSFGASIRSPEGAKKTYPCPAPRVIVADLNVIRDAPWWMAASGYADLIAKIPAGADWILAHELGAGEWHDRAWHTVQDLLFKSVSDPIGVVIGGLGAYIQLVGGLMLSGFAMQDMLSSRPASGAEHMFSHILEMRNHTLRDGRIVPHGLQVGVYTYFMTRFYENMLAFDYTKLDVDSCVAAWPDWPTEEATARKLFEGTHFPEMGVNSTRAKYLDRDGLRDQLMIMKTRWPEIKAKLEKQLMPAVDLRRNLRTVRAPVYPEDIHYTREASLANVNMAAHMRDRFNALDFTYRTGQMMQFARDVYDKDPEEFR